MIAVDEEGRITETRQYVGRTAAKERFTASATSVAPGETVRIAATVVNRDDRRRSHRATLSVDGLAPVEVTVTAPQTAAAGPTSTATPTLEPTPSPTPVQTTETRSPGFGVVVVAVAVVLLAVSTVALSRRRR